MLTMSGYAQAQISLPGNLIRLIPKKNSMELNAPAPTTPTADKTTTATGNNITDACEMTPRERQTKHLKCEDPCKMGPAELAGRGLTCDAPKIKTVLTTPDFYVVKNEEEYCKKIISSVFVNRLIKIGIDTDTNSIINQFYRIEENILIKKIVDEKLTDKKLKQESISGKLIALDWMAKCVKNNRSSDFVRYFVDRSDIITACPPVRTEEKRLNADGTLAENKKLEVVDCFAWGNKIIEIEKLNLSRADSNLLPQIITAAPIFLAFAMMDDADKFLHNAINDSRILDIENNYKIAIKDKENKKQDQLQAERARIVASEENSKRRLKEEERRLKEEENKKLEDERVVKAYQADVKKYFPIAKNDTISKVLNYSMGFSDVISEDGFWAPIKERGVCFYRFILPQDIMTNIAYPPSQREIDINNGNPKGVSYYEIKKNGQLIYEVNIEGLRKFQCDSTSCSLDRLRSAWQKVYAQCSGRKSDF